MKKCILLLSHSQKITDGLKDMILQMQHSDSVRIFSLGGTSDGDLGSDPFKIVEAITAEPDGEYYVFADLGSAVMNAELAKDMIEETQQERYHLVDAPLVEGAFAAAITASITDNTATIIAESQKTTDKGWN